MQTGRLRDRVILQAQSVERDAAGAETITWSEVATVWAEVRASRTAREGFVAAADQEQAVAGYQVRIRYRATWPDVKDRVVWGSVIFNVLNVIDTDGRKRELLLMCEAVI